MESPLQMLEIEVSKIATDYSPAFGFTEITQIIAGPL